MSRSESPASSLDFYDSDPSEEEYRPQRTAKRSGPSAAPVKKGLTIKLNLGSAKGAPVQEQEFDASYDAYDEEGPMQSRIVDLSGQDLVRDHAIRPLWVDEQGNMYAFPRDTIDLQYP
jgi:hypothetical protein